MRKLLTPTGRAYSPRQLKSLNIKQVFDILVKLGVADRAMYRDFKKLTGRKSTSRKKKTSRKRKLKSDPYLPSGQLSKILRTRYDTVRTPSGYKPCPDPRDERCASNTRNAGSCVPRTPNHYNCWT